jgi:cytochrome c
MRRNPASHRAAAKGAFGLMAITAVSLAFAAADAERGARVFSACISCHTFEPDRHLSGPSLAGIWGRKAGSVATYHRYSDALKRADLVWNERTLDAWLRSPKALVPGNTMQFPGLPEEEARADLVAFLKAASEGKAARLPKPPAFPDLKKPSPIAAITSIRHCGDSYFVTNAKGQTAAYWEFNLRFKTDSSVTGPAAGRPVMVGQGMQGDRAQIVFSEPREISSFIREGC